MFKNFKKLLNLIITENIFKYTTEKYKEHIKKFPNIAHPAFDVIGPHISLFGRFEHNELKVLEERVFNKIDCSNSTCLDIGANIGIMTYHLSKKFPNKTIFSIEPMPNNLLVLHKIIAYFDLKNVIVKPLALGQQKEEVEMVLPMKGKVKMQGLAHVVHHSIIEWNEGEKIKVQCETLDALFLDTPISGIKMDIENFEYFALRGGAELLKKYHPVVYLELWENENRTQCFEFLNKLGYSAFVNQNNNLVPFDALKHKKQNFIFKI